jgi:phi LC3 family holin
MINTLKMNVKNKAWWIALISALIVLGKLWGIDLTDYIGKDWQNTVNSICTIAILLGISVDTTSQNIGGATNEIVQETSQSENNTTVTTQTEDTTTAINNTVSENSVQASTVNDAKLQQIQQILNQ